MALVVLLKGINVGGHRTVRPSQLATELERFDVVNVGAAGTFVVRRPVSRTTLRAELMRRLPFAADVMICDARDVLRLAASDPFADQPSGSDVVHFVSVLARRTLPLPAVPMDLPADGEWCVRILSQQGRFILGLYRRQMKTIGYLTRFEKLLGVPVTTRNWNTILTIVRLLKPRPRESPR